MTEFKAEKNRLFEQLVTIDPSPISKSKSERVRVGGGGNQGTTPGAK